MKHLGLIFALCVLSSIAQAKTCGSMASVKDKVEILRTQAPGENGDREKVRYAMFAKDFMPVECDDVVQTGPKGSAKVVLGDDKIVLAPDSRIEISRYSGTDAKPKVDLINLTYGKMRGLIYKRALDPEGKAKKEHPTTGFKVRTFSAVVGVRGTDLFASYDPNGGVTEQAVIEGQVEVTQTATNQRVLVGAGQQVTVEAVSADFAKETSKKINPLKVVPIRESVKKDMRIASAIAKDDKDFATPKAVTVLGQPQTWTIEREEVPKNLKDIENNF